MALGLERNRRMICLKHLITENIRLGSIIMSNQLGAYNDIKRLEDGNGNLMNYKHHKVNHKESFINFDNPWTHIQTNERHWEDKRE